MTKYVGILHSAKWIWAKPEDEEEVSPEHVICAKELGDVQLSNTFWATSSVKWPPFQREVHSNVIISQQTWEDHQHCGGGISLFFVSLTGIWELVLLFRCSANDDACLVSYMMHEDGKRMTYEKVKVATLILLCLTSFEFQADSTLVRNASTQQKKHNGSTMILCGSKTRANAGMIGHQGSSEHFSQNYSI